MNRLFLRYPYPIAAVILLIFAWVVAQRLARGVDAIIPLAVAAVVVWLLGTFVFIYLWPQITVGGFKRAIAQTRARRRADPRSTRCTPCQTAPPSPLRPAA